ncbi:hypothetical protein [Desulfosporosinus sp. BICA1-9]|uniref:hypothetical protein n=1 Tax=Desulfosporosinus sp. BICA1-9 TaxID=1531958 RepID=UPI00054B63D6|nr:hypothetical protein [Desulfosporosinus sp. BICA1-9]KJS47954.1 MAG: hypothetical protein VR66_16650 [Peptococcaceae bacterium BRH_c23]KJS88779.1 MAG: hypothetical protein JL57_10615 [Desulfosporosinus sp. BICA1-9]HBW34052.1 hypothetical protein [Desulfosporosinus sp.]
MNTKAFSFDIRRLMRDPVLRLFMLVPFIALAAVKLFLTLGEPMLERTEFTLGPYYGYILAVCLTFSPYMLGTITAFLMIDERDESIYELMSVMPIGYAGYIANRLFIPFALCIPYTILSCFILAIVELSVIQVSFIALLSGVQSVVVSLIMFSLADNKVQGLTYSKGLNIFVFAAMADLLDLKWVSNISAFIPFYWTSQLVRYPANLTSMGLALVVHLAWLYLAIRLVRARR